VPVDVLAEEVALRRARRPYAVATVVWAAHPTAGRAGDRAVVTGDGRLRGWVGGSCTEPVVVREALRALAEGSPRLLRLGSPARPPISRAGVEVVTVPVACVSEGELEVLLQPHLPPPYVVAVGAAPMLDALVEMARAIGYDAVQVERGGDAGVDLRGLDADAFVVVATFGRYDEDALTEALTSDAAYVGLVASAKRAASVLASLRASGVPEERVGRVRAPAGLDLGSTSHPEIAVAVLADVVATNAARRETAPQVAAHAEAVVDPVCGMAVDPDTTVDRVSRGGVTYLFCSAGCRRRFEAAPEQFVADGAGSE
jgi:xanthine dehydrogenase accessory factor